jgi:hypothetical protein
MKKFLKFQEYLFFAFMGSMLLLVENVKLKASKTFNLMIFDEKRGVISNYCKIVILKMKNN